MSLFNPIDIEIKHNKAEVSDHSSKASVLSQKLCLGKSKQKVAAVIGDIKGIDLIDYTSMGRWSMHDLLFYLLDITGPAKVWFTTWAISTKAINMLVEGMKVGLIRELHSILDRRIVIRKSDALVFLQNNANSVFLIDCHAKVILIENDDWQILIKSSANFSNNKRIETGVIMQIPEVYNQNKKWITETISGLKPFEY